MKLTVLDSAVVLTLSSYALLAQTVVVEPEQRTRIKEYVTKKKYRKRQFA